MYPYPDPDEEYWDDLADDSMKVSSGTDCTGLIPSAPLTDYEFGSYTDLYDFLPTVIQDQYEERR